MPKKIQRYQAHYYKPKRPSTKRLPQVARHPFAVPVAPFLGLVIITGGLVAFFNRTPVTVDPNVVVISDDKQQQIVSSKEPTVGALLEKLDIDVNEGDVVEPSTETPIQQDDFRINIYRAVPVEVVDGGQTTFALSARTTERSVASQAGVMIYPEDKLIKQPITDFVATGGISEQVIIDRATPVQVNLYGSLVTLRTHATTVGELLAERKIKLAPQDQVKPSLDTPLATAGPISVIRNGLSTVTVQEDIAMPVQNVPDNTLSYGVSAVRQQGAPGKKAVVYEVNTQNGVEVGRRVIQATVVQEPVPEVRVIGSNLSGIKGDMARAGISPDQYEYADYIISRESGWCPTKWQGEHGGCPAFHGTPSSSGTGYGLCQSTPAWKMASSGEDWATNPVTQLKWCTGYANGRYGSWQGAYNFWTKNHWW
ncbi:MAG: hypothetical protein JWP13_336 [Candidatus Saccharibacteria bacterium]|nr:hypothetical protein [Candidatus Saccharibacteria bacterium]